MRTLIHSKPDDIHAVAVQKELLERGHMVDIWYARNFPSHQQVSVRIDCNGHAAQVADEICRTRVDGSYDVCWNRRRGPIQSAGEMIPDADKQFVSHEIKAFLGAAIPLVGKSGFWVNDEVRANAAENKLFQLKVAQDVGLKIPETFASNSAEDIRGFVRSQKKTIYKPMAGYLWDQTVQPMAIYTSAVTLNDLNDDNSLRACPGIYQQYIEKAFEVRAVVMGEQVSACAIHARNKVDWRVDHLDGKLNCSSHELPLAIRERCVALVKALGLVFGCIDLIVSPAGEYVFLENNEAGQFLWMEESVYELPLLDQFVQFLASADPSFQYVKPSAPARWQEVKKNPAFRELWLKNRRRAFCTPVAHEAA